MPIDRRDIKGQPSGWQVIPEEIDPDELQFVVESLKTLIEKVRSETIRGDLLGAYRSISSIVRFNQRDSAA